MENADNIKQLLIRRYSKLSNVKEEKTEEKLDNNPIEVIIEKHNNITNWGIVLFTIVMFALVIQLVALYLSNSFNYGLIPNILLVILFQKGLHDNFEKKEILKTLKEIG
ncbi:MAG: hypothetical protein K0M50_17725 [Prolixibacteraceae bacterium]|nr:hypothetical protein [Prolixibacteraceae bacterium]